MYTKIKDLNSEKMKNGTNHIQERDITSVNEVYMLDSLKLNLALMRSMVSPYTLAFK